LKYKKRFIIELVMSEDVVNKSENNVGQTVKFFVVLVVLAAILFGGVYFAKARNASFAVAPTEVQSQEANAQESAPVLQEDDVVASNSEPEASAQDDSQSTEVATDAVAVETVESSDELVAEVPSTGLSIFDSFVMVALIFGTFYVCWQLRVIKLLYRKLS
jgi:hypothetical protein